MPPGRRRPSQELLNVVGMASCFGSGERYLGLLATAMEDQDAAAAHFEAALASNAAAGVVSMLNMVRDDYAAMLLARSAPGDAERAEALRKQALADMDAARAATQVSPTRPA
jgi:hypothetical protein